MHDTPTTEIYTLSYTTLFRSRAQYEDTGCTAPPSSLPFLPRHLQRPRAYRALRGTGSWIGARRSEEHTSELQSHSDLVCRLLLEKKKDKQNRHRCHISSYTTE